MLTEMTLHHLLLMKLIKLEHMAMGIPHLPFQDEDLLLGLDHSKLEKLHWLVTTMAMMMMCQNHLLNSRLPKSPRRSISARLPSC